MSLDRILEFTVEHSGEIAAFSIVAFLIFFAIHLFLGLKEEKGVQASAADLKSLEDTLRKVIESAPYPGKNASAGDSTSASAQAAPAGANSNVVPTAELQKKDQELQVLKAELAKAKAEVQAAKANSEANAGSKAGSDELKKRLEELEARLSEYEIIEDDIANLSLYKDENRKLKEAIAKLQGGQPVDVSGLSGAAESSPDEAAKAAALSLNDEAAELLAAIQDDSGAEAHPPQADETPSAPAAPEKEGDILSEFAAALGETIPTEAPAKTTPQPAPAKSESAPSSEPASTDSEGALAGFDTEKMLEEAATLEAVPGADGVVSTEGLGDVDPDKMIAEAAELGGAPEVAASTAPEKPKAEESKPEETKPDDSALASFDTDKMVAEAEALKNAPPAAAPASGAESGDVGETLISEFEQFVSGESNKGG